MRALWPVRGNYKRTVLNGPWVKPAQTEGIPRIDQIPPHLYTSRMPHHALKCIEGYQELAGRMILRAIRDLQHPEHRGEALDWFNGGDAHLTFQHCAHILGLDEDVLRQSILKKSIDNN